LVAILAIPLAQGPETFAGRDVLEDSAGGGSEGSPVGVIEPVLDDVLESALEPELEGTLEDSLDATSATVSAPTIEGVTGAALAAATGTSSGLLAKAATYSASTLSRAQGVLRKNLRLDLTDGLLLKQLILILRARYSQP